MRSASLGDERSLDTFCDFYGFLIGSSGEGLGVVDSFSLVHDSEGGDGDGLLQQLYEGESVGSLDRSAAQHLADQRMLTVHAAGDLAVASVYGPGVDEIGAMLAGGDSAPVGQDGGGGLTSARA